MMRGLAALDRWHPAAEPQLPINNTNIFNQQTARRRHLSLHPLSFTPFIDTNK
jgi:hypothetical protein